MKLIKNCLSFSSLPSARSSGSGRLLMKRHRDHIGLDIFHFSLSHEPVFISINGHQHRPKRKHMSATLQLEFQWQLATETSISRIERNSNLGKKKL